jgi:hypothetical protein
VLKWYSEKFYFVLKLFWTVKTCISSSGKKSLNLHHEVTTPRKQQKKKVSAESHVNTGIHEQAGVLTARRFALSSVRVAHIFLYTEVGIAI